MIIVKTTKRMKLLMSIFISLLCSSTANAGGNTDWLTITSIYSYSDGVVLINVSPSHTDPDGCGNPGSVYVDNNASEKLYTTALAAFAAGKQVSFYMSGCVTESGSTGAQITRIAIK